MTFSEKIVKLRKIKGLTQDEFASAVGVSRQAVYKWESGQSYPEVAKLIEIKLLFNISIDDLLDESYEVVMPEKKKKRISRAKKAEIEAEINNEIKGEEPAPVVEPVKEEKKEEPVAVVEEVKSEAPLEAKAETQPEEKKEEKKVSFFQRIFGRK